MLLKFGVQGAGPKRRVTTWTSALAVLGAWLRGVIPVVQVARAFAADDIGEIRILCCSVGAPMLC
jgi:hypothetical protein